MKRLLMLMILGMFLITLVSASQPSLPDPVQAGECIELPQSCASCTYNNITTIVHPTGEIDTVNGAMTKSGSDYNYSYCDTGDIGMYIVSGIGDLDGTDEVWTYTFKVTYDGKTDNPTILSTRFIVWIILGIIFITAGFVANRKIEEGEGERYSILLWMGTVVLGISGLIIIEDFLSLIIGGAMALVGVSELFNVLSGIYEGSHSLG